MNNGIHFSYPLRLPEIRIGQRKHPNRAV